jgi:hypothetical protein
MVAPLVVLVGVSVLRTSLLSPAGPQVPPLVDWMIEMFSGPDIPAVSALPAMPRPPSVYPAAMDRARIFCTHE